jgi:citrate synthase
MTKDARKQIREGLEGIVVAETTNSMVDGINGRLLYVGYQIDDLAHYATFEEVVYLLWHKELPTEPQLKDFQATLAQARGLPQTVIDTLRLMPEHAHPMSALRTGMSMLGCVDDDSERAISDESVRMKVMTRIVATIPTIIAAYERIRQGLEPLAPREDLGHAANFLYMMQDAEPGPAAVRALDAYLVLLADHGFNASTFSGRVTAATLADPYSAVTSAIGTLKGSLHGGANQRVMEMLQEIDDPAHAKDWVMARIEAKERIMGIGHRVYKTLDPRAKVLRVMSSELAHESGSTLHAKAVNVADTAVEYFEANRPDLKLYPNVDFYSAVVLDAAGIPVDQFTPAFAMSRSGGWCAHLLEQYRNNRLIRPRADYEGPSERPWLPLWDR